MFDVGLPELLVIVIVALVVVGPKDLPRVVRGFARTIARMRRMVDEFMGTVNDYVRESELQELREAVEKTRKAMKGQGDFDDLLDPVGVNKPAVVNDPKIAPPAADPANEPQASTLEVKNAPAETADPAPGTKAEGQGTP
ncbi:MAG: Sec-independent protein translocase protein TatB [Sphingomonadales bacterium]